MLSIDHAEQLPEEIHRKKQMRLARLILRASSGDFEHRISHHYHSLNQRIQVQTTRVFRDQHSRDGREVQESEANELWRCLEKRESTCRLPKREAA
jgi:hypothetical protein